MRMCMFVAAKSMHAVKSLYQRSLSRFIACSFLYASFRKRNTVSIERLGMITLSMHYCCSSSILKKSANQSSF